MAQLRNTAHTSPQSAARLEFKFCLQTLGLGLGFGFGLGQSFVRLESVGCILQLPWINNLQISP